MSNHLYEFETTQIEHIHAQLMYISRSKYGGDWVSVKHSHNFTELFYVIHGQGLFRIEDESFPLKSDDLVIVNPNVEHTEEGVSSNPLEYIALGIKELDFLFGDSEERRYSVFNSAQFRDEFLFYFRSMLSEIERKPVNYASVCQALLDVLLVKILRFTNFTVSVTDSRKSNKECAMVKRYIDQHYAESITLDMLADLTHMNKYYLVHSFNRETGTSPINYLIQKRIKESKLLLCNTDYSLSHISQVLGFSSPSYFSQSFKRLENMSPNEYRHRNTR